MKFRRRYLLLIPLLLILSVFVEIGQVAVIEDCAYCDARKTFRETRSFLFGLNFESQTNANYEPSKFEEGFPDYGCVHQWNHDEGTSKFFWDSPLIGAGWAKWESSFSRSALVRYYNSDGGFRARLHRLIDRGIVSRERVLKMARTHCMCGGRHFDPDLDEDIALEKLISEADEKERTKNNWIRCHK